MFADPADFLGMEERTLSKEAIQCFRNGDAFSAVAYGMASLRNALHLNNGFQRKRHLQILIMAAHAWQLEGDAPASAWFFHRAAQLVRDDPSPRFRENSAVYGHCAFACEEELRPPQLQKAVAIYETYSAHVEAEFGPQ